MIRSFRSITLYRQMMLFFLLLLIPLQLIGSFIYLRSLNMLNKTAVERVERSLQVAADTLENRISDAYNSMHTYFQNGSSSLRTLLSTQSSGKIGEKWLTLRDVMKDLKTLCIGNECIEEITLYFPTMGFYITSEEYHPLNEGILAQIQSDFSENAGEFLHSAPDSLFLTLTLPIRTTHRYNALTLAKVEFSLDYLSNMLNDKLFAGECLMYQDEVCFFASPDASAYLAEHPLSNGDVFSLNNEQLYVFFAKSHNYSLTLANLIPHDVLASSTQELLRMIWLYAAVCLLMIAGYSLAMRKALYYPIQTILSGLNAVESGQLNKRLPIYGPGELRKVMEGFNSMSIHLEDAMQTIVEQKTYAQQMEFKQLQSQINPHFLYNTFFTLEHLVNDEDLSTAKATCRYLGEYFQYITYPTKDTERLSNEYEHAMIYLKLQKLRFEERIRIDVAEVPQQVAHLEVPKLIFQPLLENMFTHGIRTVHGIMRIRTSIVIGDYLALTFENSAPDCPTEALSMDLDTKTPNEKVTGLKNIHRRIRLKYGEPYGLILSQSDLGGLRVTVLLPNPPLQEV